MSTETETPCTDVCPHCGKKHNSYRSCVTEYSEIICDLRANYTAMTEKARKAEAEVDRLRSQLNRAVEIADVMCYSGRAKPPLETLWLEQKEALAALKEEIK